MKGKRASRFPRTLFSKLPGGRLAETRGACIPGTLRGVASLANPAAGAKLSAPGSARGVACWGVRAPGQWVP